MNNEIDHKNLATADVVRLLGELQHMRSHALTSLSTAPEDKRLGLLVLANRCQQARRTIQKKYFPELEPWGWCIVKSASQLWELSEELTTSDAETFMDLKSIIDESVLLTTGEDISNCSSCIKDADEVN